MVPRALAFVVVTASAACGLDPSAPSPAAGQASPFAVEVVRFKPGANGGFGADALPGVVLGPPQGGATESVAGTDVLSLGSGGEIVLKMGEEIVDHDGVDLIVFENPFKIATSGHLFAEPGAVSVSDDDVTYSAFPCAPTAPPPNGCAGFGIVRSSTDNDIDPTDAQVAGGDDFDLATIGAPRARFVKIVDLSTTGAPPKAGFDLDAVAVAR